MEAVYKFLQNKRKNYILQKTVTTSGEEDEQSSLEVKNILDELYKYSLANRGANTSGIGAQFGLTFQNDMFGLMKDLKNEDKSLSEFLNMGGQNSEGKPKGMDIFNNVMSKMIEQPRTFNTGYVADLDFLYGNVAHNIFENMAKRGENNPLLIPHGTGQNEPNAPSFPGNLLDQRNNGANGMGILESMIGDPSQNQFGVPPNQYSYNGQNGYHTGAPAQGMVLDSSQTGAHYRHGPYQGQYEMTGQENYPYNPYVNNLTGSVHNPFQQHP